MFSWLRSWWRGRVFPRLDHLQVVVYTRRGCHLCEAAWDVLEAQRRRYHFQMTAVDVDTDPALARQYGEQVPVVAVGGRVRFRGAVNPVLLARLLRAEAGRSRRSGLHG